MVFKTNLDEVPGFLYSYSLNQVPFLLPGLFESDVESLDRAGYAVVAKVTIEPESGVFKQVHIGSTDELFKRMVLMKRNDV